MTLPALPPPTNTSAEALVVWAAASFGADLALGCSTGIEDCVLTHLLAATGVPARVFLLDTGRLHPETYETFERLRRRYPSLRFQVFTPEAAAVEALVAEQGLLGFRESLEARHACCEVRKLQPLRRALVGCPAWLAGLRRAQSPTRLDLQPIERDGTRIKVSPLLNWTEAQTWDYAKAYHIPTHPLHAQGFPSIGCAPCTRATQPGEDLRAGRWWWEQPEHKECGLHRRPTQS